MEQPSPSVVEVYRSDYGECAEHSLALEAVGIRYAIQERPGGFAIVVAEADAVRARSEIEAFEEEARTPVPSRFVARQGGNGWAGVIGYIAVLALITALQHNGILAQDWLGAGRMNAELVRHGEIWRVVTALTLHVDFAHLISNVLIGSLIGLFAGQVLGSGLAWISILLAGAAGNLLSISFRPAAYSAIGASTAVFAGIGILAAYEWTRRTSKGPILLRYAPIVGGVLLLSYLGTGGERTDVISHVAGFLCGLLFGFVYGKLDNRILFGWKTQLLFGTVSIGLVVLAWIAALTPHGTQSLV